MQNKHLFKEFTVTCRTGKDFWILVKLLPNQTKYYDYFLLSGYIVMSMKIRLKIIQHTFDKNVLSIKLFTR